MMTANRVFYGLFLVCVIITGAYFFHTSNHFLYRYKSTLYAWAGDTSIILDHRSPVGVYQMDIIKNRLEPGDILLTRRNGYISNFFIPGYWTHSAIYVGDFRQVSDFHSAFESLLVSGGDAPADNGGLFVIEALSEGIKIRPLEESMDIDALMVLRPRLKTRDIHKAIANAFQQLGKPYDYNFDFNTTDKVACTELIFHSFYHSQVIMTHESYGRPFTTPSQIARDHELMGDATGVRLDFVLKMDEKGFLELKDDSKPEQLTHLGPVRQEAEHRFN